MKPKCLLCERGGTTCLLHRQNPDAKPITHKKKTLWEKIRDFRIW